LKSRMPKSRQSRSEAGAVQAEAPSLPCRCDLRVYDVLVFAGNEVVLPSILCVKNSGFVKKHRRDSFMNGFAASGKECRSVCCMAET